MIARLAIIAALLAASASAQVVETPAGPPVRTNAGLVAGKTLASGVRAWFGVPFAAPPVRALRWRDPQPVTPWAGVWNADRFAPECIQTLRGSTINHYFGEEATSEDCLYLNIWAPPAPPPPGKSYPVVVWAYGGGFTLGSASMANYSGEALAAKGVVYVGIAYRVGAFGFLAHPDLTREAGAPSGNYGFKDQIAALKWVRGNIAGVGGDARNVTVVGQSAGAMSLSVLQASPAARGLFERIVAMSGSAFGEQLAPQTPAEAEANGMRFQEAIRAPSLAAMRALPADRVLATLMPRRSPLVADGVVATAPATAVFAAHGQADVPVMIGFTRDEAFGSLGPAASVAEYEAIVRKAFPASADAILRQYPASTPEQARRALRDIDRDLTVGRQMFNWASAQAANGKASVFAYEFARVHPYTPGVAFADHDPATIGAYHTGDVPYWLGTLDSLNRFRTTRDWQPLDRALASTMMDRLLAFARDGNPGGGWPAFNARSPKLVRFGETVAVVPWPNAAVLPLLSTTTSRAAPARIRD